MLKITKDLLDEIPNERVLVLGSGNSAVLSTADFDAVWLLNYTTIPVFGKFTVRVALDYRVNRSLLSTKDDVNVWSPYLAEPGEFAIENLGYEGFSSNCEYGIFYGHTVAYATIQLLCQTAVKSITFSGVDLSYWKVDSRRMLRRLDSGIKGPTSRLDLLSKQVAQLKFGCNVLMEKGIEVKWTR